MTFQRHVFQLDPFVVKFVLGKVKYIGRHAVKMFPLPLIIAFYFIQLKLCWNVVERKDERVSESWEEVLVIQHQPFAFYQIEPAEIWLDYLVRLMRI